MTTLTADLPRSAWRRCWTAMAPASVCCGVYGYFDAARDGGTLVYRGCSRSEDDRRRSEELYAQRWPVGWHAVVCFAYRFCGEEMHVLVLDNHDMTGPRRWVLVEELDTLYTLAV